MHTTFPKKGIYRIHIYFPTYCLIQALTISDVRVTRGWIFKCLKIWRKKKIQMVLVLVSV